MRAGLALAEHASSILPATKTYHLGKNKFRLVQKLTKIRGYRCSNIAYTCNLEEMIPRTKHRFIQKMSEIFVYFVPEFPLL